MFAHLIRVLSILALCVSTAVMLYPRRSVLGVDLSDLRLQAAVFALYMVFRLLTLIGRLRNDPILQYRSNVWEFDSAMLGLRVKRATYELLLLAASMEVGQWLLPHRDGRISDFAVNASVILVTGGVLLVALKLLLRTSLGLRLVHRLSTLDW